MQEMTITSLYDAVEGMNEQFMAAYKRGDATAMAELYTEDGQILPPNSDFVTGKPAIQAFWQALMDMGIDEVNLQISEIEGGPGTAFEVSTFTLMDANGQALDQGKYIVIWKQQDDGWKLHRDIFNSSMPAPAP